MAQPVRVGAVVYDARVTVIWSIIRDFFEENGCPVDVSYYANYDLQVAALARGDLDIAWNSPLAWLDAQRRTHNGCRAIAMRDTDRDRVSYLVARRDAGIASLDGLRGRTIAVGAEDSPQATLIPLGLLRRAGLEPGRDVQVRYCNVLVGKHGDHTGGELDAFHLVARREADVCAVLDLNWNRWSQDGTISPTEYTIVARTERFDHCVFTVRNDFSGEQERAWLKVLFSMRYDDPRHREMMDLEGLKAWLPGRTTGFGPLAEAVAALHVLREE